MSDLFSKLLLTTECTEFDRGAEVVALALAQRCGLPLATVFPLLSNPEYEALAPQVAQRAEKEAADKIAQLRSLAQLAQVNIDLRLRRGEEPYREIVQEARDRGSDLIIARRRGKRGFLANLLVGEMVSKVVAHAPCHVLLVPTDGRLWSHGIVVAVEPHPSGMQALPIAAAVARQCALPLHVVCVVPTDTLRTQTVALVQPQVALAEQQGVATTLEVRVGEPFEEVLAAQGQTPSDLIVLGRRGQGKPGRVWVGGVAQKVLGLATTPVLLLKLD